MKTLSLILAVLLLSLSLGNTWGAVDLNGDADGIEIDTAVVTTTPITMACWFKDDINTAEHLLVGLSDEATTTYYVIMEAAGHVAGDPIIGGVKQGGSLAYAQTTTGFTAGKWHHACFVQSATDARAVYIDGGSKGTSTAIRELANLDNTTIGILHYTSYIIPIDGSITEVAIWNVALTDAEVALLASARIKGLPLQIRPANLVLYLPMDENPLIKGINNMQFDDYSGKGNDGTGIDVDGDSLTIGENILSYPDYH